MKNVRKLFIPFRSFNNVNGFLGIEQNQIFSLSQSNNTEILSREIKNLYGLVVKFLIAFCDISDSN